MSKRKYYQVLDGESDINYFHLISDLNDDIDDYGEDLQVDAVYKDFAGFKIYREYYPVFDGYGEKNRILFENEKVERITAKELMKIYIEHKDLYAKKSDKYIYE